ncbi:WD40 domain-containing protein beta Propeller [Sesbania bispinosa]|nr:WD40 domain-containing protein beta Propeller [Sesbania bispinosa]
MSRSKKHRREPEAKWHESEKRGRDANLCVGDAIGSLYRRFTGRERAMRLGGNEDGGRQTGDCWRCVAQRDGSSLQVKGR